MGMSLWDGISNLLIGKIGHIGMRDTFRWNNVDKAVGFVVNLG